MNITQVIKEHHQAMIDKGFYDECDCNEGYGYNCSICNGTGSVKNKNIGELLMLIVSELAEALEAHRFGRFSNWERIERIGENRILYFEKDIKDTFEDEIADVFLRLFDLCGYLEIEPDEECLSSKPFININIGVCLLKISYKISSMYIKPEFLDGYLGSKNYGFIFSYLMAFCQFHNIPIEKHIYAKMAYNKSRPHKHGKAY